MQTKLTTAATSKNLDTLPDILLMQDNAFQKNVISYPDAFKDLTGSGVDFSKFPNAKTAYSVVDGKNYGVPFDNGAAIAAYRTDVLKEAGYTEADFTDITWSKYQSMGEEILAKTGKPLLSCTAGESDLIMIMLQSAGGSLFDKDGNPSMVGNDKLKKVIETYVSLVKSGVLVEVNDWDQYVGTMTNSTVQERSTAAGLWRASRPQKTSPAIGRLPISRSLRCKRCNQLFQQRWFQLGSHCRKQESGTGCRFPVKDLCRKRSFL